MKELKKIIHALALLLVIALCAVVIFSPAVLIDDFLTAELSGMFFGLVGFVVEEKAADTLEKIFPND